MGMLDMSMSATQRALAQNRPAGRVLANFDHRRWRLDLGKLLRLRRVLQRGDGGLAARDYLRHFVEVSRTDEALVLHCGVAVAVLAGEFLLLQARVGSHAIVL